MRARPVAIQSLRRCSGSAVRVSSSAETASVGSAVGSVLASLGRPTTGIGLAAIRSAVYGKVHNLFHVDQHRCIEAAGLHSARRGPGPASAVPSRAGPAVR